MKTILLTVTLLLLNVAVWTLNSLMVSGSVQLSAKSGVAVNIQTEPERVKISIDNEVWTSRESESGWIQSPATIYLPAGQYKISIERPGYATHTSRLMVNPGNAPAVKAELELKEESLIETEITASDDLMESFTLVVDGGLASGPPPLRIDDLTPGTHSLELRWKGLDGFRRKPLRCAFAALSSNGNNLLKINISRSGKKLRIPGCKKI